MLIAIVVAFIGKFFMSYTLYVLIVVMTIIQIIMNELIIYHDEEDLTTKLDEDKSVVCCFMDNIS